MTRPTRSRLTRWLHWLTLLLFLVMLASGLAATSQARALVPVPAPLLPHILIGPLLFLILIWRIWRKATGRVAQADTGIAETVHWIMLLLMTLMAASGLVLSIRVNLLPVALAGGEMPDVWSEPLHTVHGLIYLLLVPLILGHAAMALWHQFLRRDGTLMRMIRG